MLCLAILCIWLQKKTSISIILGVAVMFGDNAGYIFKKSKDNDSELLTDEEEKEVWVEFQGKV